MSARTKRIERETNVYVKLVLLTHRENVAWQNVEVCTWHLKLVLVALHLMPKTVVDHLVHQDVTLGHFPSPCHFYYGHVVVISNVVVAIEPVNDALSYEPTLVTHSCVVAMNVCH